MANYSVANTRRTNYQVSFGPATALVALGYVDEVDPSGLKMMLDEIKVGSVGKATLGLRFVGLDGMIKTQMRELNQVNYAGLAPWVTLSGTLPFAGTPLINTDLYASAAVLNLHPIDQGASTLEDLNFAAAIPITPPGTPKRTGEKDDVFEVEWRILPDRAKLPALVYYYVGAIPSGAF